MDLADHIRDVPDYPQPGIIFKDLTPLFANPSSMGPRLRSTRAGGSLRMHMRSAIETVTGASSPSSCSAP